MNVIGDNKAHVHLYTSVLLFAVNIKILTALAFTTTTFSRPPIVSSRARSMAAGALRPVKMEGIAEMELAIEVRGAYKGYGSLRVLKGLDMSVPRGRM